MTPPRVDFYLLSESVPDGSLRTACDLTRKIVARAQTVYIQTENSQQARRLDELLWTFDQGSFVPHRLDDDEALPAPVLIGCRAPDTEVADVLVALSPGIPEHFQLYPRVVDIVDATDAAKKPARQRYRAYRERGCELDTHHIRV